MVLVLPPDYPVSADNIALASSPKTAPASSFTQELLEQAIKQQYTALAPQTEVESELFERTTVAGFEAIRYQVKTVLSGVEMHQEMLILFLEGKQVNVTFTKVTGKYDDAFAAVAASIQAD